MNIWVVAEIEQGHLRKSSLEALSLATVLAPQGTLHVVALSGSREDAEALKDEIAGVAPATLHHFCDERLAEYDVHRAAPLLTKLFAGIEADIILAAASITGRDLIPRVAACLARPMASDCVAVSVEDGRVQVKRPIFAGKAFAELSFSAMKPAIITLRPNVFERLQGGSHPVELVKELCEWDESTIQGRLELVEEAKSKKADLTEAEVIVSGGRSLKSADNFEILENLAEKLGATVGASRAAVDAGYASHDMQVGQTGKVVSPKLYVACGISGAIQHLAGMRSSQVIVAINSDPQAPIFKVADYGVVGDLFEIVPLLSEALSTLD